MIKLIILKINVLILSKEKFQDGIFEIFSKNLEIFN